MNHPAPPAAIRPRRPFPTDLLAALKTAFGDRASTAEAVRAHHGRDESPFDPQLPDAVVFAQTTDDVCTAVKLCARYGVPIIPYGNGSSLEGHLLAVEGGVSIDLSGMNRVLSIEADDLTATVEAGVRARRSTRRCVTRASSSRSTRVPTRASAACRRHAPQAPTPFDMGRCARMCSASPSCWPTVA